MAICWKEERGGREVAEDEEVVVVGLLGFEGVGVDSEGAVREGVLVLGVELRTEPAGVEVGFLAMVEDLVSERRVRVGWMVGEERSMGCGC